MSQGQPIFIVHRIPGRVRLSVEALRRNPALAERVVRAVRTIPCVTGARADVWAASLVIEHDAGVPLRDLLSFLDRMPALAECGRWECKDRSKPDPRPDASPPPHPARTTGLLLRTAARVNKASQELTPPHVDLRILVPGALIGYGFYRVLAGGPVSRLHWITLLKYGFDLFAVLNQGTIRSFIEARSDLGTPP